MKRISGPMWTILTAILVLSAVAIRGALALGPANGLGVAGAAGATGATGPTGPTGPTGANEFSTAQYLHVASSVAVNTMFTATVAANQLGTVSEIIVTCDGYALNNSGGNVTFTFTLNYGSASATFGPFTNGSSATRNQFRLVAAVREQNATNVQELSEIYEQNGGSNQNVVSNGTLQALVAAGTVSDTSSQTLSVTGTMGTSNANAQIDSNCSAVLMN